MAVYSNTNNLGAIAMYHKRDKPSPHEVTNTKKGASDAKAPDPTAEDGSEGSISKSYISNIKRLF